MKRKIIALCVVVAMLAVAVIGSTMAYFTDTDEAVNVMTMGNVDIKQNEQKRDGNGGFVEFEDTAVHLVPAVYATDVPTDADSDGYWDGIENAVDKTVSVTNTGKSDAYVRTWLAFEVTDATVHKNFNTNTDNTIEWLGTATIDGQNYQIAVYTYGKVLTPGMTTESSLKEFAIDKKDNNAQVASVGGSYEILAFTQAVQASGFANANAALDEAFGDASIATMPWEAGVAIENEITVTDTASLQAAFNNAASGVATKIVISNDIDLTETVEIPEGAVVVLELGDNTIANNEAENAVGATLINNGNVTVNGGNIESASANAFRNFGTATLNGVNLVSEGSYVINNQGTLTVNDSTASGVGGIYNSNATTVINGGTYTAADSGRHGVYAWDSNITINGGTFAQNGTATGGTSNLYPEGNTVMTINDGIFTVKEGYYLIDFNGAPTLNIKGGTLTGMTRFIADGTTNISGGKINFLANGTYAADTHTMNITGGVFAYRPNAAWIADGYSIIENTDNTYGVGIYAADNAALDEELSSGTKEVYLGSGNYIIPDSAQGKTLTITGNGDTAIATQDDGSYEGCDYSLDGATVTFNNITITTDSSTYTGYARCSGTYNNCTINGTYTLYGKSVFNNCTFNVTGDVYNIWTWGAGEAEFNNCTFNCDGKSMLVYNSNLNITFNDCVFNDNGDDTITGKSAIETGVDNKNTSYNIVINNCTVNGFAENNVCVGYKNIVGNKNSMGTDKLNIVIDGVDVY